MMLKSEEMEAKKVGILVNYLSVILPVSEIGSMAAIFLSVK